LDGATYVDINLRSGNLIHSAFIAQQFTDKCMSQYC
jgi:hypothetical protein